MGEYIASSLVSHVPVRIVTPVGMLGYGFSSEELDGCLSQLSPEDLKATALILDSGSTDSGPTKLAFGSTTCPRTAYVSDIRKLLQAWDRYGTPIIIGSAGGDGSNVHVDLFAEIIAELQQEDNFANTSKVHKLKVVKIYSEIDKSLIRSRNTAGRVSGCGSTVPCLTDDAIDTCPTVVAQMGAEPYIDAMVAHPDFDVIIGGRAYDPSPYVAYAAFKTLQDPQSLFEADCKGPIDKADLLGRFYHMGKIMECGALCAVPKSYSALATIYSNGVFDVTPLSAASRCTPTSVAAHTFYEKSRPDIHHGPGGAFDLTNATYVPLTDGRSVRVSGARFRYSRKETSYYSIKLEGARAQGYRTMFMGGIRDSILISQIDSFLDRAKSYARSQNLDKNGDSPWQLEFHVYGRDGVMGDLEPRAGQPVQSHEVFIVGECVAETQEKASAVASSARIACMHGSYPGQMATGGNFAFGVGGKPMLEMGPCAEFAIYHLLELDEGEQCGQERVANKDETQRQSSGKGIFPFMLDNRFRMERFHTGRIIHESEAQQSLLVKEGAQEPDWVERDKSKTSIVQVSNGGQVKRLSDIAKVIRSKNAGPFEITLDVLFDDAAVYRIVKESGVLNRGVIARLYGLKEEQVISCTFFDQALGFKATVARKRASGGAFETDVQGSQQYAGLFGITLPAELIKKL